MRTRNLLFYIAFFIPAIIFAQASGKTTQNTKSTDTSRIYAIIIGISNYKQIYPLNYADKDAVQLFLYLQTAFPANAENFFVFLNDMASKSSVEAKLSYIDEKIRPGDRVILYFSGHGDIEETDSTGNFLFLLGQAQKKNYQQRENTVLEKKFFDGYISRWIEKKAKTIFICDACRSGTLIGGVEGLKNNSSGFLQSWQGQSKILACQPDESSYEFKGLGGGSGTFTYYLILGLRGLADVDKDGKISLLELQTWLTGRVPEYVKKAGAGHSQIPEITGDKSYIVSRTNTKLITQAKIQMSKNVATNEYIQLFETKGKTIKIGDNLYQYKSNNPGIEKNFGAFDATDLSGQVTDNYLKSIYYDFTAKIKNGDILLPDKSCALFYYNIFNEQKKFEPVKKEMKIQLLDALHSKFDEILTYLYNGDDSSFYKKLESYNQSAFRAIAGLAGDDKILLDKNAQKQLFAAASLKLLRAGNDSSDAGGRQAASSEADFQKLLATDSLSPYILLQAGRAFFLDKKYSQALDCYERYKKQLPNDEYIYFRLSKVYMEVGRKNDAKAALEKAIAIDPGFSEATELLKKIRQ